MPLGNALDEISYFDCLLFFSECPYVRLNDTGQILKVHEVRSDVPVIRVATLEGSATWGESPHNLTWLTEMEVLAHVSS
jgi:hypothetical protein